MRPTHSAISLTSPQRKLLRRRRLEEGLTTRQMGELCDVSHSTIGQIETGERGTSLPTLRRIAKRLGLRVTFKTKLELKP